MTCEQIQELVPDHLDGVLEPSARRDLEAHLATCASCREEVAALRVLWQELETGVPVPSARLRQRFDAAHTAQVAPRRWRGPVLAGSAAAAALAALLLLVVLPGTRIRDAGDTLLPPREAAADSPVALLLAVERCERAEQFTFECERLLLDMIAAGSSPNVTIAAIEALVRGGRVATVTPALLDVLSADLAPMVQAVLVEAVAIGDPGRAGPALRAVLADPSYPPSVRRLAGEVLGAAS